MQLFYQSEISDLNTIYDLDKQESLHASKVLRKTIGDIICVTNGKGHIYESEIVSISKRNCSIKILTELPQNREQSNLTIAVAPTKNISRLEWFIEKSVEIGIKKIDLFVSQNSERQIVKTERLQLKALSAMKQSVSSYLPKISSLQKFKKLVEENANKFELKFIAFCKEEVDFLKNNLQSNKETIILIGPEGGFSKDEVEFAEQFGFKAVSLGSSRLRTETAAIYATSIFSALT